MKYLFFSILLIIATSCIRNKNNATLQEQGEARKVFEVKEVVHANAYSYLKVSENFKERWVAVKKADIKPGEVYFYDSALQMNNFTSKDLDRTFDIVYFINQISREPFSNKKADMGSMHRSMVTTNKAAVAFEKAEDELSLADIFEKKDTYALKDFEIRGKVVKVTPQVMGKNWIHIQDGSDYDGKFDLTVTTIEEGIQKGDVVVFKGKLSLDKDFGYGYSYEVLMEDARCLRKETTKPGV